MAAVTIKKTRQRGKKKILKDYNVIVHNPDTPLPNQQNLEWAKPGDFFNKFTLFDENRFSQTESGTVYIAES